MTIQEYHLKFGTNTKLYNGLKSKGKKDQMENCDILNANAEEGSGTDSVCDNDSSIANPFHSFTKLWQIALSLSLINPWIKSYGVTIRLK